MVERLTKDLGAKRIAIFYQDDAFGRAGLAGVQQALERRRMELVAEGTYERNTVAVKRALLDIRRGKPDAVIMVGAYKPCATLSGSPASTASTRPSSTSPSSAATRSRGSSGRTGQGSW